MSKHSKIKSHKKQHYVPRCYLKAWHDPTVPPTSRLTPYVWRFDKNGNNPHAKAPENLFTETDIYTIEGADGARDLRLEQGFQGVEDQFTRIRNLTFNRRKWPDAEQLAWVYVFVATAHVRTAAMRNFHAAQWAGIRKHMEDMKDAMQRTTPEQRESKRRASIGLGSGRRSGSMTIDDVRHIEKNPVRFMVPVALNTVVPIIARMHMAVLCTDDPLGFVTTDHPCTWFDPESYKQSPIFRGPALASPSIEITLPISPGQCIAITHRPDFTGYINVQSAVVDEVNRRHIAHADTSFVACRNETRPEWFQQPPLPDDAWEKVRERKIASGEWPAD